MVEVQVFEGDGEEVPFPFLINDTWTEFTIRAPQSGPPIKSDGIVSMKRSDNGETLVLFDNAKPDDKHIEFFNQQFAKARNPATLRESYFDLEILGCKIHECRVVSSQRLNGVDCIHIKGVLQVKGG